MTGQMQSFHFLSRIISCLKEQDLFYIQVHSEPKEEAVGGMGNPLGPSLAKGHPQDVHRLQSHLTS